MTGLYTHSSYTERTLSKKPSQRTLRSLETLDSDLDKLADRLKSGAHPIDVFIPKNRINPKAHSLAEFLLDRFTSTMDTEQDRKNRDTVEDEETWDQINQAIVDKDYQTDSPVEASFKRGNIWNDTLIRVRENVFLRWVKKAHAKHKKYNAENNKLYPFRLSNGKPIHIIDIAATAEGKSGESYSSKHVKPFYDPGKRPAQLAKLYNQLICKPIEKVDNEDEEDLIGQDGVFATRRIPKGTCIGVYGGVLFPNVDMDKLDARSKELLGALDTYLMKLKAEGQPEILIDGDTIISKINTTFTYKEGQPRKQAPLSAFNTERVDFDVELADKTKTKLAAFFTLKDIQPGEEIRYNYGYSPEIVQAKFAKRSVSSDLRDQLLQLINSV